MKMPEVKKVEADGRKADYTTLTATQKVAALDARLGQGLGAAKQRARLAKQLELEKAQLAQLNSKKSKKE